MGTPPVNAKVSAGEFLGRNLDFYTVVSANVDFTPVGLTGAAATTAQGLLNQMVEMIAQRGQPVILTLTDSKTIKFAIEHHNAWESAAVSLQTVLNNSGLFGTITVTFHDLL